MAAANQMILREKLSLWERKINPVAPLTDAQKDSFIELTTQASNRPLPIELPLDEPGSVSQKLSMVGAGLKIEEDPWAESFDILGMGDSTIDNAQQFFAWFNRVESQMEEDEEQPYKVYCDQLHNYKEQCDQVLEEVSTALSHLSDLQKQYVEVSTKTNALHEACEQSMNEQTQLVNTAETISSKLSYFNELERINQKLSSPAFSVTNEAFVPLLSKLDECIAHITSNPHFKEAELYQARFQQCLTKMLSLVKSTTYNTLQQATLQVRPKVGEPPNPSDNAFTLFYGKFRTNAPKVKTLMDQVEQRLDKSPEYQILLDDCHLCYFTQRQQLLGPSITQAITELASKYVRDHCALVRSGCSFMAHVCEDEHQLFFHFFSKPTAKLDTMLESLCQSLYDVLRPLIIHVNHLETLAELCSILKNEMIQDHVKNNPDELHAFETVILQMLEDVQERLVYRSSVYVQTDILMYQPASGDLAYPEKLEMMKSIAESLQEQAAKEVPVLSPKDSDSESVESASSHEVAAINESAGSVQDGQFVNSRIITGIGSAVMQPLQVNSSLSPADLHGMWYPTVRRTLVCLSKLYRCIDRSIFQGLSQEILQSCIQSLITAGDEITKRKTELDGTLFLIKHLLILREQIAPFQVEFAIKETMLDFTTTRNAAVSLFNKKTRLFSFGSNNAFLEFLFEGAPQVTEHYLDSKKDVDNQLKKSCEAFIKHVTHLLVLELNSFISKAEVVINIGKEGDGPKVALRTQPFAKPEKLHEIVMLTNKQIKTLLPKIFGSMSLYLANRDTEYILFRPAKSNVQQAFLKFETLLKENYGVEDQQIVGCPTAEEVNLILSASS